MYAYFKQGREPLSSYTHFWGAAAGVLGILALLLRAHQAGAGGMVLAGALVLHQSPTGRELAGGVLMFVAIVLAQRE